jgi:hypothetical protein
METKKATLILMVMFFQTLCYAQEKHTGETNSKIPKKAEGKLNIIQEVSNVKILNNPNIQPR